MEIKLVKNSVFVREDGTYDLDAAINLSGKFAGECYSQYGLVTLLNEPLNKTEKRVEITINNGHHSVYDHNNVTMEIVGIPKMLAMVLNNEKQYTTSEKSLRYTQIISNNGISDKEVDLYNEWMEIYQNLFTKSYGYIYDERKIKKLAQENARYLVTTFIPTQMIYTTSVRQLNYLASFMKKYIEEVKIECIKNPYKDITLERLLAHYMEKFISELKRVNILDERLMNNEKSRKLSLFGENIIHTKDIFDEIYQTKYKISLACLAQAQRHRTLNYQMERTKDKEFFVPPILSQDKDLTNKWLYDMESVKDCIPQGELVLVKESGSYDNFILKCKERLCSAAQLEIMLNTRQTLLKYRDALEEQYHYLAEDIQKYTRGARCTFPDFKCTEDCKFKEGKTLTRKI